MAQRAVSRERNQRSNRSRKAVQRVTKLCRKISRLRLNFHLKTHSESRSRSPRSTSRRCNACGHTCRENRASQARFSCVACDHVDNVELNVARNILERAAPSGINVAVANASVA